MPNPNRERGDYFERQTRDALAAHRWLVIRAGGSRGVADLVALRFPNSPLLVQCKVDGRIAPAERQALLEAATHGGAVPVLAERTRAGWVHVVQLGSDGVRNELADLKVPARPRKAKATTEE